MDDITTTQLIIAGSAAAIILIALAVIVVRRRRVLRDREHEVEATFGEEYERLRSETGRRDAVDRLETTAAHLEEIDLRKIGPDDREALSERWAAIQHSFLDAPADAVRRADELVTDTLRARNLPVGSVEERLRSVAYLDEDGTTAVDLRSAHELFVALEADDADDVVSADLREAMLIYQQAFELVLDRPKSQQDDRVDARPSEPVRRS